ncbi:metal ABC transporter permease [Rhodobacteraceae bacterium]|nr:metal ABC transporter permease [Paracoccaceae bacterium]
MSLLDSFLVRATLAGIGVAIAAAPLGCFVVWRRMAFFGDATAHAAILGVALALALDLPIFGGVLVIALAMALFVTWRSASQSVDTALGVASHSALAAGLVAVSFLDGVRIDIEAFLFGDILAVGRTDLVVIWLGALMVAGLLSWRWHALLTATLNEDLASAAGINPKREQLVLTLALAIVVAVAIKVVGALLISAMLIIPAAAARPLAETPERMALFASLIGVLSVVAGLAGAWFLDTPAGPSIVCAAALIFLGVSALRR